jgi:hypothetical protein
MFYIGSCKGACATSMTSKLTISASSRSSLSAITLDRDTRSVINQTSAERATCARSILCAEQQPGFFSMNAGFLI